MQALALCEVLKSLNFEPILFDTEGLVGEKNKKKKFIQVIYEAILRKLKSSLMAAPAPKPYKNSNYRTYIHKYINCSASHTNTTSILSEIKQKEIKYVIVGSDQVWRKKYVSDFRSYFFDFIPANIDLKRLSYAASLGVDEWEYSEQETTEIQLLLSRFDAISVRESSAKFLLNKRLGLDAQHVLDPTMLLDSSDYLDIFQLNQRTDDNRVGLMAYVLDPSEEKTRMIDYVEKKTGSNIISPATDFTKLSRLNAHSFSYFDSPLEWVKSFRDAEFIITDSFHGCVFSIIFKVPFVVIPNQARGKTRMSSLLASLGMESRMVEDISDIEKAMSAEIDWMAVHSTINRRREESVKFLTSNLQGIFLDD